MPMHIIECLAFRADTLEITIDGKAYSFPLSKISKTLAAASDEERNMYEISPSGYGIHWPLLDEDVSVSALLGETSLPSWTRQTA